MNVLPLPAKAMLGRALLLVFLLSSCSDTQLLSYGDDTNFLLFDHPNSEGALADVRARAEYLCGQRKERAIKTESVCSLTTCTTSYQCSAKADAVTDEL